MFKYAGINFQWWLTKNTCQQNITQTCLPLYVKRDLCQTCVLWYFNFLMILHPSSKTNKKSVCDDSDLRIDNSLCFYWSGVGSVACQSHLDCSVSQRYSTFVPVDKVCALPLSLVAAFSERRGFPLKDFQWWIVSEKVCLYFDLQRILMKDTIQAQFSKIRQKVKNWKGMDSIAQPLGCRSGSACLNCNYHNM